MKKKKNRAFACLVALVLLLTQSITVCAIDITISGTAKEYKAYKLLDLTVSLKVGEHSDDCDGTNHTADCYNYSYTVNSKYGTLLKGIATAADKDNDGTVSDSELLSYIENLDNANMRSFADSVYKKIVADSVAADYTVTSNTVTVNDQGYYLIAESQNADDPDSTSLVMVDTAGELDISVTSKEGIPTLEKKINSTDMNDKGGLDAADIAVGDTVSFTLEGSMPANIDNYNTYKYVFHDKLSSGLSLDDTSIEVYVVANNGTNTMQKVDSSKYSVATTTTDNCSFEVAFDDVKAVAKELLGDEFSSSTLVKVEYDATVTSTAVSGNPGNPNESHLEFSNDPYISNSTSSTPDDKVVVFQFTLVINKVDKDNTPIEGAEFKLYKRNAGEVSGQYTEVGAAKTNDAGTVFTFAGIDQGDYKLVEETVPDGYNKADDILFSIVAEYDDPSDNPTIKSLKIMQGDTVLSEGDDATFTIDSALGTFTGSVINTTGIKLPTTGEFGRAALLYGGMGALVFGLAVVVVARCLKDVKKEN